MQEDLSLYEHKQSNNTDLLHKLDKSYSHLNKGISKLNYYFSSELGEVSSSCSSSESTTSKQLESEKKHNIESNFDKTDNKKLKNNINMSSLFFFYSLGPSFVFIFIVFFFTNVESLLQNN